MPDQGSAANEHAILQEITAPLATLPDDPVPMVADVDFPVALRGYDRLAVDAYVKKTSQLVAELQATRSPEAAIRRALERVGEQISGILRRAHDTAEQITAQSRREAEDRLQIARQEAEVLISAAGQHVKDLDSDTDRIWAERRRIVNDARTLAQELMALAETAAEQFPEAEAEEAAEGGAFSDAAVAGVFDEAAEGEAFGEVPEGEAFGEVPEGEAVSHLGAEPFAAPGGEPFTGAEPEADELPEGQEVLPLDEEDEFEPSADTDATAVMPPVVPPEPRSGEEPAHKSEPRGSDD